LLDAHHIIQATGSDGIGLIDRLDLMTDLHGSFNYLFMNFSIRIATTSRYVAFSSAFFAFEPRSFGSGFSFLGRCA